MSDSTSLHDAFNGHTGRGEQSETDEFNEIQHLRLLLKEAREELRVERERSARLTASLEFRWAADYKKYLSGGVP